MKLWKEFKAFVARGNVIDLAVGVIIGGAFGKIVSSLVDDIIMPPIGILLGPVDFANLFINLSDQQYETLAQAEEAGAATINYGLFINTIIEFLIIAVAVFLLIHQVNRLKKSEPPKPPSTKSCPHCFTTIPIKATRCPNCTTHLETEEATTG